MGLHEGNSPLLKKDHSYLLPSTRHQAVVRESRSFAWPACIPGADTCLRVTFHVCQAGRKQSGFCNIRRKAAGSPADLPSHRSAARHHSPEGSVPRGKHLLHPHRFSPLDQPPRAPWQPQSGGQKWVSHTKQIDHVPTSLCAKKRFRLQMLQILCTENGNDDLV